MIDLRILDAYGSTDARLKEIFTSSIATDIEAKELTDDQKEQRRKDWDTRQEWETWINQKLMEHVAFGIKNYEIYAAVDLAWDSAPINKQTFPLMLYAQGKMDVGACADALTACGCNQYVKKDSAGKTIIDAPRLNECEANLVRSIITRRLSAQSNKYANLWPIYSYAPRGTSPVAKLRGDVVSQKVDIMADDYNYRHQDIQVLRDVFLYGFSLNFVRSKWDREIQWAMDVAEELVPEPGKKPPVKAVIIKEGLDFTNPHPSRSFWDNAFPISNLNTDTGPEFCGFWDVVRYDSVAKNTKYWNRDQISYSSNVVSLFSTYAQYFTQYYTYVKAPQPPTVTDPAGQNDRANNTGLYAQSQGDSSMIIANIYRKIIPKDWGIGEYPFPVWTRSIVAGDKTVIFSEFLPSRPAAYCGHNCNDNRQINISIGHELLSYQDQMSNLQTYLLMLIKADNVRVLVIDIDTAHPDHIKAFRTQLSGQNYYSETVVLEVSGTKMQELGIDPKNIINLVETKSTAITIVFEAMRSLMTMVERMMALSPQEQGQPAPREISATETNLIAGTTESVYGFISDSFDEYRDAKKGMIYEAMINCGDNTFKVPIQNRYTDSTVKKAGFDVLPEDSEEERVPGAPRRFTVIGTTRDLQYDYVFNSRDGAERPVNTQAANVMVQLLNGLLMNPAIMQAIPKDKLFEMINEVIRMSGAGMDLKLELQEGDQNSFGPDQQQQLQGVLGKITDALAQHSKTLQQLGQATQQTQGEVKQVADATQKQQEDLSNLQEQISNNLGMGAPAASQQIIPMANPM